MQVLGFLAALGGVGHWSRRALEVLQRSLETLQELSVALVEGVKVIREGQRSLETIQAEQNQHLEAMRTSVVQGVADVRRSIYELERDEGFLATMSLRLTFIERRMMEAALCGQEVGRLLVATIEQVQWLMPWRATYSWFYKEMLQHLQALSTAHRSRGSTLSVAAWSLVVEGAYRQVETTQVDGKRLEVLKYLVRVARSMQYMQGHLALAENEGRPVMNLLAEMQKQEKQEASWRQQAGVQDVAAGSNGRQQVPDLGAAMWRNYDATATVQWKSPALQTLKKEKADLRQRYGVDLLKQTVKEMKAEPPVDGVPVWKAAWMALEHGNMRRLRDRRTGPATAPAPRRRINTKTYVLLEDSESSEGIGDTGDDAGRAVGGDAQVAEPVVKKARRDLEEKEDSHWQNLDHAQYKKDLRRHLMTSPSYGLDAGATLQD